MRPYKDQSGNPQVSRAAADGKRLAVPYRRGVTLCGSSRHKGFDGAERDRAEGLLKAIDGVGQLTPSEAVILLDLALVLFADETRES